MPHPRLALLALLALAVAPAADEEAKIVRPADGSALKPGPVEVIARVPGGGPLLLDGQPVEAAQPFAERALDIRYALVADPAPGEHTLEAAGVVSKFFVGERVPEGFAAFVEHPGINALECTSCHGFSRRGTFRFQGDCFGCHVEDQFMEKHPHPSHVLEQCGMCHNPHGAPAAALLRYPKETACRICHSL